LNIPFDSIFSPPNSFQFGLLSDTALIYETTLEKILNKDVLKYSGYLHNPNIYVLNPINVHHNSYLKGVGILSTSSELFAGTNGTILTHLYLTGYKKKNDEWSLNTQTKWPS